uniref:DUF3558 domain-containing protein n=1 Tax=Amycolatopsis sp. CA-096443 TaxID=3239919 RepID=UPI003F495EEC
MARHDIRTGLRATPPTPAQPSRPARAWIPALAPLTALALALGGCASTAPPPTPSAAPPAPAAPTGGAPTIAHPLPASLIHTDPCQALTPAQAKTLFDGTPPDVQPAEDSGVAMQCRWSNPDRGSGIGVQFVYAWTDGLRHVYATKDEGFFLELEPVQGYPMIAYGPSDDRATGRCSAAVGIADTAAFEVDVRFADAVVGTADPCQDARHVADLVLTTMKSRA